jgi:hypothetical protein
MDFFIFCLFNDAVSNSRLYNVDKLTEKFTDKFIVRRQFPASVPLASADRSTAN